MPTQEEEDKDAKRRVREERRKQSGQSSSTRRESSDRKQKDRARDSHASSKPGAYSSTELSSPRSKKASAKSRSSGKSTDTIDKSDRSDDRHSSSRASNAKSRTSKPASVPGAVSSSTSSPHARRERRKAGADDSGRSSRSATPATDGKERKSQSSGKSRTSRAASVPGAVSSTSSPQSRKERRKTGAGDAAARSSSRSTSTRDPDAVQKKLQAAGLLDEDEELATETPSNTMETTEEGGEILLQATTVDENEESKPKMRDVELVGETQTPAPTETEEPPPPEPKKRRYGIIIFAVIVLGAGAAAGAYFGTRGSSNPAVVPDSTLSPTVENITLTPTSSPPTDPPSQGNKYPPPDDDACQRVASGLNREPKADIVKNYELTMDVELSDQESQLDLAYLEKRMQEVFVPALAGCSNVAVRQTNLRYVIYNVLASLVLELQGTELSRYIESIIEDIIGQEINLVSKWQLLPPIVRLTVTNTELIDVTESPSEKPTSISSPPPTVAPSVLFSESPTRAPVAGTRNPTVGPSSLPSVAPTTSSPTVAASENPTTAPIVGPTTQEPTDLPSSMPSGTPTVPPTSLPSITSSLGPSQSPTTMAPTPEPSVTPTLAPTFEPMEGDHLQSSHYVYYMPEPPDAPVYPYNSREEAQAACETKGLTLCSKSAITNFPLCSIGWLTDDRGLWSIGNGCGFGGFTDGGFFGIFDRGGAYCCGRPLFMPDPNPTVASYIYSSREEGRAACQTRGLGLCTIEQISGFEMCAVGWLEDDVGYWLNTPTEGCGGAGFTSVSFGNNGAYCCVERPVTQAPSVAPSVVPSPQPSISSRPSLELMEGDHLLNEHYVYYMPDGENPPEYPYNSREEAQAACESKGLALCNKSAITNFPLCSIGWLTDDRGLWSIGNGCGFGGFTDGGFFGVFDRGGAYCCGRPLFMPDPNPTVASYIYGSREEGRAACQTRGLGLCTIEQITGFEMCAVGWLEDDVGFWLNTPTVGCGGAGFTSVSFGNNGAYCCAAPS